MAGLAKQAVAGQSACSVASCDRPREKRGYCNTHYRRMKRGVPLIRPCKKCGVDCFTRDWLHPECRPKECVACGAPNPEDRPFSLACSPRCYARYKRNGMKALPRTKPCDRCGEPIDLYADNKNGRKPHKDIAMCRHCRAARMRPHKMSATIVVRAYGNDCNVCGDPVDLDLVFPDPMRASVDHEIPYSKGGSHELENLRIAHLLCNNIKHTRQGFKIDPVTLEPVDAVGVI